MTKFIGFLLLLILAGCTGNNEGGLSDVFAKKTFAGELDIQYSELKMEIIELDEIPSSYRGFLTVNNNRLLFFDKRFSRFFEFDKDGKFITSHMGIGGGPKEIPQSGFGFLDFDYEGNSVFVGSSYDYYVINPDFERVATSVLRWQQDKPQSYLQNNPTPEDQRSYNLAYDDLGVMRIGKKYAYLPLASPEPIGTAFNMTTDLFAEHARILARMNIETGEIEEVFGRLSPLFKENSNVRLYSFFSFDLAEEESFVVTYRPDSLIYHFDNDFKLIRAFGSAGTDMNTAYRSFPATNDIPALVERWTYETQNRGYYTHLEYIQERNKLFRSYQKGSGKTSDGLQIYRDNALIADVEVPKTLKIIGYIDPYFYSNVFIDEDDENLRVYRFKLE